MASEKFTLQNQPSNRLVSEKPAGMHWLGHNDAILLNKAKTRIFQPTAKFQNFETNP